MMKKADVGNIIEFRNGLRGIVEKVNENSVIVDVTFMENFHELEIEEKTVVNHKNYKIVYECFLPRRLTTFAFFLFPSFPSL